jgi:aminodeoxychorismate lyase
MNNKPHFVLLNNNFIDSKTATINIDNRGFLFGDGLFETCRFHQQRIINFDLHWDRLKMGANYLKISLPSKNILKKSAENLIIKNQTLDGLVKIHISRNTQSNGYLPVDLTKNDILIQTKNFPPRPQDDNLIICDYNPPIYNFKTLNSIPYILAKIFAHENNAIDSIMLDSEQNICETSSANIFWIKNNKIFTPNLDCSIINGTIRQSILAIKDLNISEGKYQISHLENADEVFITNCNLLIFPISTIAFRNKKNFYNINYKKTLVKKVEKLLKIELKNF